MALTFHAVCLAWCFFRLTKFAESIECVRKCVQFDQAKMWSGTYTDPSVLMALGSYAAILVVASAARYRGEPTAFRTGFAWGLRAATLAAGGFASAAGGQAAVHLFPVLIPNPPQRPEQRPSRKRE